MKKFILLYVLSVISIPVWCQISTLNENFDVDCVTVTSIPTLPSSWLTYTPPALGTYPDGVWTCTTTNGRGMTPGMQCSDTFGGTVHLDTAFLMTPLLDLSGYPGSIFLQFDTKTTNLHLAANLSIEKVTYAPNPDSTGNLDLTSSLMPLFSNGDSSEWVTHVADLTSLKSTGYFYVAFRFTSASSTGSIWFLDNVLLTTHNISLNVPDNEKYGLEMAVSDQCSTNKIDFYYRTTTIGNYDLALTDILGKVVYQSQINIQNTNADYSINGLNLCPGMYFLKMGNEHTFGVTKVIVQ